MLGPLVMLSFVELIKSAGARQAKGETGLVSAEDEALYLGQSAQLR
jgi:hypothetical protein